MKEQSVTTSDGKYTIIIKSTGLMSFLRYGEPWPVADREFGHVGMIMTLVQDLAIARIALEVKADLESYHAR